MNTETAELAARIKMLKDAIEFCEADGSGPATAQREILSRYEAELARINPKGNTDRTQEAAENMSSAQEIQTTNFDDCEYIVAHPAEFGRDTIKEAEKTLRSRPLHSRPKAGSAARNQYGTFQVRYATQPQTNYIKNLMDRKDLSKVDPAKVDVEKLREQVTRFQVNKKAASAIIDTLLALPDAVSAPVSTGRPASDKQKDFLRTLLAERAGNEAAEAIRRSLNEAQDSGHLTFSFASQAITDLLEISVKTDVPAGRYALPAEDGHYIFYKVDCPTEGKWAGYIFVKQLIGSVGDWDEQRLQRVASQNVLKRIAADPEEAARMFGIKARACGMCASPLSNTRSRAAGYGETCADNNGFFYPTEDQAREILQERGEE